MNYRRHLGKVPIQFSRSSDTKEILSRKRMHLGSRGQANVTGHQQSVSVKCPALSFKKMPICIGSAHLSLSLSFPPPLCVYVEI